MNLKYMATSIAWADATAKGMQYSFLNESVNRRKLMNPREPPTKGNEGTRLFPDLRIRTFGENPTFRRRKISPQQRRKPRVITNNND
jgi:hypothetical protein